MKPYRQLAICILLLFCYIFLLAQELSWNEMEEEFNSNVKTEMRMDLDGDGDLDFDLEDDEDSTSFAKKSVDQISLEPQVLFFLESSLIYNDFYLLLQEQNFPSQLFVPPRV